MHPPDSSGAAQQARAAPAPPPAPKTSLTHERHTKTQQQPPSTPADTPSLAPAALTLPTFSLPNATALLDGAKDSIRATATAALLDHLAFKPKLCSNGLPVVTCLWDVCEGKCGGAGQICVPDYCGACNAK